MIQIADLGLKIRDPFSTFRTLSLSRQKEICRYIASLKTEESVDRNVERVVRHLRGENPPTLHALMRKPKQ